MEAKLFAAPTPAKSELANEAASIVNSKCPPPQACILLRNLYCATVELRSNTISFSSGSGIKLFNVRATGQGDQTPVVPIS
jgi:hypothetical protein